MNALSWISCGSFCNFGKVWGMIELSIFDSSMAWQTGLGDCVVAAVILKNVVGKIVWEDAEGEILYLWGWKRKVSIYKDWFIHT